MSKERKKKRGGGGALGAVVTLTIARNNGVEDSTYVKHYTIWLHLHCKFYASCSPYSTSNCAKDAPIGSIILGV